MPMNVNQTALKPGKGGKRVGAGRPKGARSEKNSKRINDIIAEYGITPVEVMMRAMKQLFDEGEMRSAAGVAKDLLPYLHPRLNSVEHIGDSDNPIQMVTRVELVALE